MKTWHFEILIVAIILSMVTLFFANNIINWITLIAILLTFNHAQIGDRLQARQSAMIVPDIECYWKLNKLFIAKEVTWIVAFLLMGNYAAIVGSLLFAIYPFWRKYYRRKIKPLNNEKDNSIGDDYDSIVSPRYPIDTSNSSAKG
jgi:hypothetical protein